MEIRAPAIWTDLSRAIANSHLLLTDVVRNNALGKHSN
jgi:hypothetical protein